MNYFLYAVIFSIIAGCGTVIGSIISLFFKSENKRVIARMVSFVMGVFMLILCHDLIPSAYETFIDSKLSVTFSIILIIVLMAVGYFIAEKIEHLLPHKHLHEHKHKHEHELKKSNMKKTALLTTLAASIHKFPEGMAVLFAFQTSIHAGIALALGIAIHHIPEGVAIGYPIYKTSKSKSKVIKYAVLSGLTVLLGTLFAYFILNPFQGQIVSAILFALVSGTILHLLICELLPTVCDKKYLVSNILLLILGILLMLALQLVVHHEH